RRTRVPVGPFGAAPVRCPPRAAGNRHVEHDACELGTGSAAGQHADAIGEWIKRRTDRGGQRHRALKAEGVVTGRGGQLADGESRLRYCSRALKSAPGVAPIAVDRVPIIALLARLNLSVTAGDHFFLDRDVRTVMVEARGGVARHEL